MNNEFFDALGLLAKENGIDIEVLIERIKQGILKAIKKEYPDTENILIDINTEKNKFDMKLIKTVVEGDPVDEANEINIDVAKTITKRAKVGGVVEIKLNSAKFGRVAAQQAKQQIKHDIKEIEKERLLAQYEDKVHECVSATVQKVEPNTLNAILTIDNNEVYLVRSEQIPDETLEPGDIVKVYVCGIANPERKPSIKISRKHKDLVKRLFELEVPEIYDGTVEVKSISREAGSRSKIAVYSKDPNVDAIGACIGPKRSRISKIVEELKGEKIDLILWSEDDAEFIGRALSPATVKSVEITGTEPKTCKVVVPNNQLSLAIGNKGQNAKLASRLTGGYKIDIIPENVVEEA
ncbi:MAG: transcription termination/antitermination protein NusA [Oscillospiraceae bacterium]|nr:transcription termination/antitermination protein NusA [Oscillospiraceae bacterium]